MNTQLSVPFKLLPISRSNINEFEQAWLAVENESDNSFFTSWSWVKTWVNNTQEQLYLLDYPVQEGRVFGIFCGRTIFHKRCFWLHRTGIKQKDQIWTEHNQLLSPKYVNNELSQVLHSLFSSGLCDEVTIGVSERSYLDIQGEFIRIPRWSANSYVKELRDEFSELDNLISSFSKNTRSQVKRAFKFLSNLGDYEFTRAENLPQALEYFLQLGELHKQRWQQDSGFFNDDFVQFHSDLIHECFAKGVIDILVLKLNGKVISGLYNFVYKGKVYFYLSGIEYKNSDNKFKPGLITHVLAMKLYASEGVSLYDFMGGDSRYKKSLSNQESSLDMVCFQKKTNLNYFVNVLRKVKSKSNPLFSR